MNRDQDMARMADEVFDLVIVGGGITGAMLAFDAAHRGMMVALVEKGDFGAATSAASSKVLHGGIRFLRQLRLDKVRESSLERIRIRNLVPHLCGDLPFVIPTYKKLGNDRFTLGVARLIYEAVGAGQNKLVENGTPRIPASRIIDRSELIERAPWIANGDDITGGLVLPEIHMTSSERVTWSMIDGARQQGAAVANYLTATALLKKGNRVTGVRVSDNQSSESFDVQGRIVANCAGPWIDLFDQADEQSNPITAFCRGAHLVAELGEHGSAVALPTSQKIEGVAGVGGRNMFLIPWRGRTLVGTSYSRHDCGPDQVEPSVGDIRQLLDGINGAVGHELLTPDRISHSYAGLYPLTAINVDTDRYQGATDFRLLDHSRSDQIEGYISVFGAKFTTARLLAERAADLAGRKTGKRFRDCQTRKAPASVSSVADIDSLVDTASRHSGSADSETIVTAGRFFGSQADKVLQLAADRPELAKALGDDGELIAATAVYSAKFEYVVHLDDFVFRRTGLGTAGHPGADVLRSTADLIGDELQWSQPRRVDEIARVERIFPDVRTYSEAAGAGLQT